MERTEEYEACVKELKATYSIDELKFDLDKYSENNMSEDRKEELDEELNDRMVTYTQYIEALKEAIHDKISEFDPEHLAAAAYFEEEPDEITEESWDNYGLRVFSYGRQEVAVGTDEQATEAAGKNIKDSLWAFNADFIASHTQIGYKEWFINAIETLQRSKSEDANDDIEDMIEDLDEFIDDAISEDGRSHFLATYDGDETEIEIEGETYYCYRLN